MIAFENPDQEVDVEQARRLIHEQAAQLIDVREQHERDAGHIPGDRYLDMQHVAPQADTIDKDRPVIFYCRVGIRSGMTAAAFNAAGWKAYNLRGGLLPWATPANP